MRNAESRNGIERSPRARQEGPATYAALPADVQQGTVPAGVREHLLQPGSDDARASEETADDMSEDKIEQITGLMRGEQYRFSPARRVYIPKKNGKLRPLGLPSWSDKLVGEVVRLLLEAYYDPEFSDRSHGFRKRRGCHTALREIHNTWTGTTWFVEGDISDCFGSFDHEILLGILAEKIHDQQFLRLIRHMLKAGYLEEWEYRDTLSGVPQGGLCAAAHNPPYEQRWVMRSAWRLPVVGAVAAVGRCA
jgi:hypothetical protein